MNWSDKKSGNEEEFEGFKNRLEDYIESRDKVIEEVKQGDYEKAYQIGETEYAEKRDSLLAGLTKEISEVNEMSEEIKEKNEKIFFIAKNIMFLAMAIGFLGSLALGIVLSRHIIHRVRKTDEFSEKLGEGDLTQTISDEGTDELGHMATSLNTAVENMRTLVGELANGTQEISNTTEQLSATMDEISVNMEMVRDTTSQTSAGTEELAASTEEISTSIENINHSVSNLEMKVEETEQKAL